MKGYLIMSKERKNPEVLLKKFEAKDRSVVIRSITFSTIPVVLALILLWYTGNRIFYAKIQLTEVNNELHLKKQEVQVVSQKLINAREASWYLTQGINSYHAGRYSDAIGFYDEAIKLDPRNPVIFDLKGYSLFRNKEFENAVLVLKKSIEIDPNYIWGYYDLALAYWANGEEEKAVRTVEMILEMNPTFKEIIKKDGQFNRFKRSEKFRELIK